MFQPGLFETLPPVVPVQYADEETIEQRFQRFHRRNPHVYDLLRKMALALYKNNQRMGMKGLFEVLRWNYMFTTSDPDFKLNNNYTSLYARLLMEQEPALRGFFETRRRRAI